MIVFAVRRWLCLMVVGLSMAATSAQSAESDTAITDPQYASAYKQFRLLQEAVLAKRDSDAKRAGDACVTTLDALIQRQPRSFEALALQSACYGYLANLGGMAAIRNGSRSGKSIEAARKIRALFWWMDLVCTSGRNSSAAIKVKAALEFARRLKLSMLTIRMALPLRLVPHSIGVLRKRITGAVVARGILVMRRRRERNSKKLSCSIRILRSLKKHSAADDRQKIPAASPAAIVAPSSRQR